MLQSPAYSPSEALSPNFYLSEFVSSRTAEINNLNNVPSAPQIGNLRRLAGVLELVRTALSVNHKLVAAINISSGYRSASLNVLVGGSATSAHTRGLAADFTCAAIGNPKQVCQRIMDSDIVFDQLIYEGTWVHFGLADLGQVARRQVLTAVFNKGQKTRYLEGLI